MVRGCMLGQWEIIFQQVRVLHRTQGAGLSELYDSQTSNVTGTFTGKNTAGVFVYVMSNLRLGVIVIGI